MVPNRNSARANRVPRVPRLWGPGITPRIPATLLLLALFALAAHPQNPPAPSAFSVHGTVLNAATGQPLPRALVLANGESGVGALTDSDGRFTLDGLSAGPNVFQISRPGYEDAAGAAGPLPLRDMRDYTHTVFVTAATPDLTFALRPTNAIEGRVDLSTGDPAQGIVVTLLENRPVDGRLIWRMRNSTRVRADGTYRFAHLPDGDYAVFTQPASATGESEMPDPSSNRIAAAGFPQTYYPDSPTFSGAAHLHVAAGDQAQANLSLTLRTFHLVRGQILLPSQFRAEIDKLPIQVEVTTADGTHAPYPAFWDPKTFTVRAILPDGVYTLSISAIPRLRFAAFNGPGDSRPRPLTGSATLTVAGHPITNLRIPLAADAPNPLQVSITRTSPVRNANAARVYVFLTQAGPLTDGMQAQYAQGTGPGALDTVAPSPGRYWVHTTIADPSLCEASFTAGGANLGREPLLVAAAGATAPLTLSLRDDCASLRLSLPPSAAQMTVGEEPAYTVYVVPDFPVTNSAIAAIPFRASSGGSFRLNSLTPGAYHVYTFAAPVDLEYHNPALLASLHGQAITLDPGASADLTLEVPAP